MRTRLRVATADRAWGTSLSLKQCMRVTLLLAWRLSKLAKSEANFGLVTRNQCTCIESCVSQGKICCQTRSLDSLPLDRQVVRMHCLK